MELLRFVWLRSMQIAIVLAIGFGLWGGVSLGVWQGILLALFSFVAGIVSPISTSVAAAVFLATGLWYLAPPLLIIGFIIEGRAIKVDTQHIMEAGRHR